VQRGHLPKPSLILSGRHTDPCSGTDSSIMAIGIMSEIPLLVLALTAGASYLIYLTLFRLYLSPIARFPGPKLAALTRWYEFYYEIVLKGRFTFHIQELHRKYGTLIDRSSSYLYAPPLISSM
jgi:hypothetical protein